MSLGPALKVQVVFKQEIPYSGPVIEAVRSKALLHVLDEACVLQDRCSIFTNTAITLSPFILFVFNAIAKSSPFGCINDSETTP